MNIILLPGFMTDAALWDDIVPSLQSFGTVVVIDPNDGTTVSEMAQLSLSAAPDQFIAIGFSMGGYVAREVARLGPGRTIGLVQIATSARGDTPRQARSKMLSVSAVDGQKFRGLSRGAITSSLHADRVSNETLIENVRAMSERVGADVLIRQAGQSRQSDIDRLSEIKCPTLVIAGDGDKLRSIEESREISDGISGAELVVIKGVGHMIPLENPKALLAVLLPWLRKHAHVSATVA